MPLILPGVGAVVDSGTLNISHIDDIHVIRGGADNKVVVAIVVLDGEHPLPG
ncbi:hypothetical protein ES703_74355 [subsurface metagenome]